MITVRPVTEGDLPALLGLVTALAHHHGDTPLATIETLWRDFLGDPRWMHGLVAEVGGEVVGYAALLPLARLHLGQRGMDLHHLFVAEGHRNHGIGRALVQAALDHARGLSCDYLTVTAHPANREAQAFYPKLGFFPSPRAGVRFAFDLSKPKSG